MTKLFVLKNKTNVIYLLLSSHTISHIIVTPVSSFIQKIAVKISYFYILCFDMILSKLYYSSDSC